MIVKMVLVIGFSDVILFLVRGFIIVEDDICFCVRFWCIVLDVEVVFW